MTKLYDTIVIGAGQAGLAMGYTLQQAGKRFTILEAHDKVTGAWRHGYDSLKLFSPIQYSSLPGLPFPGDPDTYPSRDAVIAYLQQYADHFQLPIETGVRVEQVSRRNDQFVVQTTTGKQYRAHTVVAATGSFNRPNLPTLTNQSTFDGTILHSSRYQHADPFIGKKVVVVGAKNSALQIAVELAEQAQVTLATRHPVNLSAQMIAGKDVHFWIKWIGLDTFPFGYRPKMMQKILGDIGAIDVGNFAEALASGNPNVRPMFERFTANGVQWSDGSEAQADAVIFATGFRPNLDYLQPLGALSETGQPQHYLGASTAVDGLYYMGLSGQRSLASATIRGVGADAKFLGNRIDRYLAGKACCRPAAIQQQFSHLAKRSLAFMQQ